MTKSATIKHHIGFLSNLPVGSIIAWHKDLDGTPQLPPGWAECNGQTVDDSISPYYLKKLPNLNGEGRFLRGGSQTGDEQDDAFQGHWHHVNYNIGEQVGSTYERYQVRDFNGMPQGSTPTSDSIFSAADALIDREHGTPRIDSETRPINMSVVWIIKIKQVTAAYPSQALQAEEQAPPGALYVSRAGNVGIGTDSPQAGLHIQSRKDRVSLRVGQGSNGNDFTMDVAGGQGLASLVAGAQIKPDGKGYTFLGTRGASRIVLHDGSIRFLTSDQTSGVPGTDADGLSFNQAKLILTNVGNVGIGDSNPPYSLYVRKDQSGWQGRYANRAGAGVDVYLSHGDGYGMHIRGYTTDSKYTLQLYNRVGETNRFLNDGRVFLGLRGNVGIGTTNPGAKLDVAGDIMVSGKKLGPVYRLYNKGSGDHFYTTSAPERDSAIRGGYADEGIAFYAFKK